MRAELDVLTIKTEPMYLEWFKMTRKDLQACSHAQKVDYMFA